MSSTRFCRFCGHPLHNPEARFCPSCGQELAKSPAAAAPSGNEPPQPHLVVRAMGEPPREVRLTRTLMTVGRMPDSDIVLPQSYISGHHGRLEFKDGAWAYTDLNSTNGTFVNGEHQTATVSLHDGDILRIGDPQGNSVSLTFRQPAPGPDALVTGIAHIGGTRLGPAAALRIGRDPQSDLHLDAPVVSWQHARLDHTPQGDVLTDLNSTNGTFVNGQRLRQPVRLNPGDVVQIGPFKLIHEGTGLQQYGTQGGVRVDGIQLTREVGPEKHRRRILHPVDLSIYPREFVALVGGSGAGKSTLLKALNGFTRVEQGQVLVNGDNLYQHFDLYRMLIGYVPQDDIIHKELTVENALRYAAQLRLPPDTTAQEIERRVAEVLRLVEMSGHRQTGIGQLSGGQRKRVSIAVELLAEPRLFFLDEPTSGLDPGLDKKMMQTLRRLADGGRTVVLVTHATANITLCDHVCFMAQGRMVYFGPPEEARKFFGINSDDFADIYATLDDPDIKMARQKAQEWEARFKESPYYAQYVAHRIEQRPAAPTGGIAAPDQLPRINPFKQFAVLTRRYVDLVLRDRLLLTILLSIMPIIGLLLLLISQPNWLVGNPEREINRQIAAQLAAGETSASYYIVGESQTLLFMMGLASVLLGLFASAYEIVKEQPIYQRERMVGLRLIPYLSSKVLVLSAFALVQCLLLLIVLAFKVEFPTQGTFLPAPVEMYITLFLGAMGAIMIGLFISSLVPNTNTVIYLILFLLFFQIIFAGVIFELPGATREISRITQTRWVIESLGVSADLEALNTLTRNDFQPDSITREVSVEIPKPDPDWKPVTVMTVTQEIEVPVEAGIVRRVPVAVPQVTENPLQTITETVTREITIDPDPVTIREPIELQLDYTHSAGHLLFNWTVLSGFGLLFAAGTLIALKRRDIR